MQEEGAVGDCGQSRVGFFPLMGATNAGKSTLVNRLVGQKVAIVTPKVQTTRMRTAGVVMKDEAQLVFWDTPGLFKAKSKLELQMVQQAWEALEQATAVVVMVDAPRWHKQGADPAMERALARLKARADSEAVPVVLVLNKVDAMAKAPLLQLGQSLYALYDFTRSFMISALKGDGVEDLLDYLASLAPEGPYAYDPEDVSDIPMRELAAEITRETLLFRLQQELPYRLKVECETWEERGRQGVHIHQCIYVETASQKAMLLGKNGARIKEIGTAARQHIAQALGQKVHLFLHVKVDPKWMEKL